MPPPNPKNLGLSPVAQDLGLGDMLLQQEEDETAELKKKKQLQAGLAGMGNLGMGGAVSTIFGPNMGLG